MSFFRRPKKAHRPRVVTMSYDEDEDNDMDDSPSVDPDTTRKKNQESSKKKSSLLSFGEELDEEEGETFKVKKSSVSRRLMKQRGKEKKEKTSKKESKKVKDTASEATGFDKIKQTYGNCAAGQNGNNEHDDDTTFIRILNGREAETVDMESSDEDEESHDPKFRKPARTGFHDTVRQVLAQGEIPDANLIHEARKRKQMAREMGANVPEFIPVDNVDRYRQDTSRVVRDDDENDKSDEDDDRIDFTNATEAARKDREKKRELFNAARDEERDRISAGESDPELEEWERQQIRKGVSQAQMHSVAREVYQQTMLDQPMYSPYGQSANDGFRLYPNPNELSTTTTRNPTGPVSMPVKQKFSGLSIQDFISGEKQLTPDMVLKQMTDRLEQLRLEKDRKAGALNRLEQDLLLVEKEIEESVGAKSGMSSRFILYQNLRGYVTDLVDCLRCKVPIIDNLEKRMLELHKAKADRLIERRRQDVKDQTDEVKLTVDMVTGNASGPLSSSVGELRLRRAAEREGRRTRRRRARELKNMKNHKDGLSSDEEETELEAKAYRSQLEFIERDVSLVFEDVNDDFATIDGILSRFQEWKDNDLDSYKESYAFMCVPKCLSPLLRLKILTWDPLVDNLDIKKFPWIRNLVSYGLTEKEEIESLSTDPDARLIPSVAEKVVIPWINKIVTAKWDTMSGTQTRKLVNVVYRLIHDWSVGPNSKSMHSLFSTVVTKFNDAVSNDVFTPIYPKTVIQNKCSPASTFASRQFWSAVKLLDNMSPWQGLLSDHVLQTLALDALLTRYILLGIRTAPDLGESAERAKGVVIVLPRAWLSRDSDDTPLPNGLQQLSRCLISIVQSADITGSSNRSAIPEIGSILKSIGCATEAKMIIDKYS